MCTAVLKKIAIHLWLQFQLEYTDSRGMEAHPDVAFLAGTVPTQPRF